MFVTTHAITYSYLMHVTTGGRQKRPRPQKALQCQSGQGVDDGGVRAQEKRESCAGEVSSVNETRAGVSGSQVRQLRKLRAKSLVRCAGCLTIDAVVRCSKVEVKGRKEKHVSVALMCPMDCSRQTLAKNKNKGPRQTLCSSGIRESKPASKQARVRQRSENHGSDP